MKLGSLVIVGMCVIFVTVAAISLLYTIALRLRIQGRKEKPLPSATAIVLGAYTDGYNPSPALAARLRAALHLYRYRFVPTIIVSGGKGADETVSESKSMKQFLILNGVPSEHIFEDRRSSDTWGNLQNSKKLMEQIGLHSAVIVTSDYHIPRALAVAKQLKMDVTGYAAYSSQQDIRFAIREVFARIHYTIVGQTSII